MESPRHRTVKRYLVPGIYLFLLGVIFVTATPCRAAEVVDEVTFYVMVGDWLAN